MIDIEPLEAKIIKQVEYYFSDLNISRDKFMKQIISENDGWISLDTMLKFNRLKTLSDDTEVIKKALSKATSGLLELGSNGIRRNPNMEIPENFDEAFAAFKDSSVYVKGFAADATLDEIIEWLESQGGKTLNVHMRRLPKDKKFKGSVFAVFEKKSDCEKFLASSEAATYKEASMIRMYREDYWKGKKTEKDSKLESRAQKKSAANAFEEERVASRMICGALLELSGLPKAKGRAKDDTNNDNVSEVKADSSKEHATEDSVEALEGPTVLALKQWISDKLGSDYPLAWIDIEPAKGIAIVRFKAADTAESAWTKLQGAFEGKPVVYANCELSGRVLSGDEEVSHWKSVLAAQLHKAQKRRSGRQPGRGGGGGGFNKRRRMN